MCTKIDESRTTNENNSEFLAKSIERATCKFIHVPGPNPILTPGSAGSWDDGVIEACDIFKDHDTYYLYYHGTSKRTHYQIGVATASSPLGPWKKYQGNPIISIDPQDDLETASLACAAIMKQALTPRLWNSLGLRAWDVRLGRSL